MLLNVGSFGGLDGGGNEIEVELKQETFVLRWDLYMPALTTIWHSSKSYN